MPQKPLYSALAATSGLSFLLVTVPPLASPSVAQDGPRPTGVVTVAGTGSAGYSGDGGSALDARLNSNLNIAVGSEGEIYVADTRNSRVRLVEPDGTIDTVEGTRGERSPDTDGPDIGGWVFSPSETPESVTTGPDGEVYVASRSSIRRMDGDGEFTEIAGGGEDREFSDDDEAGDGEQAEDLDVYHPPDMDVDAEGNLYYLDTNYDRIRKVDGDGVVSTVVGGGSERVTLAEEATEAGLHRPNSLAVDSAGAVYFTAESRSHVFRVAPDGSLDTVAGTGDDGFSGDGGSALEAELNQPEGVAVDADDRLLIADTYNDRVRRVDGDGTITSLGAGFGSPRDVDVGPEGDVYVATGARILRIVMDGADDEAEEPDVEVGDDPWAGESVGSVLPVAGAPHETTDAGPVVRTMPEELEGPRHLAAGSDGTLYVSDTARNRVLAVSPDGAVTAAAGTESLDGGFSGDDGPSEEAELDRPQGLAVDADDNLLIADTGNGRVRMVGADDGEISTVAGTGSEGRDELEEEADTDEDDGPIRGDGGPALEARVVPTDLAFGADDTLYVAEFGAGRIRAVADDGEISTVAGGGDRYAHSGDDHPAVEARLFEPSRVEADGAGNVYFVESDKQAVRAVDPEGTLTTVAGDSHLSFDEGGFSGDDGSADEAELNTPNGLAVDADDNLLIADTLNSRLREVDPDGTITTVAGTGEPRDVGDDGPATEAGFAEPRGVAVAPDGEVFLSGPFGEGVRRIDPDGTVTTLVDFADIRGDEAEPTGAPADEFELQSPGDLGVDADGTVYVHDAGRTAIRALDPAEGALGAVPTLLPEDGGEGDGGEGVPAEEEVPAEGGDRTPLDVHGLTAARDGTVYFTAEGSAVYRVRDGGPAELVAGEGTGPVVGASAEATEVLPAALDVSADGTLYIAEQGSILRLEDDGSLTTLAGGEPPEAEEWEFEGDEAEEIEPVSPAAIAAAPDGSVYFAEDTENLVRKVAPDGNVTTVAGTGEDSWSRDDVRGSGPADEVPVISPRAVTVDDDGNLYVASSHAVHLIRPGGSIGTVLETAQEPHEEDEDVDRTPATSLAVDGHGNLYLDRPETNQVEVVVRPAEAGLSGWGALGIGLLAAVVLFTAAGAVLLRDELGTLVRQPGRIPGAFATVAVLLVAGALDALGWLRGRFAR
ncbi:NHL domain-containing protein [Nocardiopsis oceani]